MPPYGGATVANYSEMAAFTVAALPHPHRARVA